MNFDFPTIGFPSPVEEIETKAIGDFDSNISTLNLGNLSAIQLDWSQWRLKTNNLTGEEISANETIEDTNLRNFLLDLRGYIGGEWELSK